MLSLSDKAGKFARLALRRRAALPTEVQVEITNRCNLSCPMCPHTFGNLPLSDMPPARFERILDQVPFATDVILTGWGEPLYHKDFLALLDACRARRPGARVRFTTNGTLLSEERAREVLARGVSRVAFSFDEVPAEGAGETLGHVPSKTALANAGRFCAMREGTGCRVHYQVAILPDNGKDILALIEHAAHTDADAVALVRLETWNRPELKRPDLAEERKIIAEAKAHGRDSGVPVYCLNDHAWILKVATHDDALCLKTDNSVYIDVRGNITPCCNLRDLSFGNVESATVAEVWRGVGFRGFFKDQRPACGGCDALQARHFGAPAVRVAEATG